MFILAVKNGFVRFFGGKKQI